jgi:hypothetical protein
MDIIHAATGIRTRYVTSDTVYAQDCPTTVIDHAILNMNQSIKFNNSGVK